MILESSLGSRNTMSFTALAIPCASMFFIWTSFYFLLCTFNPHRSYEWNCRLLTIFHGTLTSLLCFWSAVITGPWPLVAMGDVNSPFHTFIATFTLGYFIFDFLWCFYMGTEGIDMLLHHMVSICSLVYILFDGYSGPELVAVVLGTEISNPFLQIRWFMRETGQYQTLAAKLNDAIFMSMFIGWRLGPGSLLCYRTLSSPKPKFFVKLGGASLYLISWVWVFYILKFARKRFLRKSKIT